MPEVHNPYYVLDVAGSKALGYPDDRGVVHLGSGTERCCDHIQQGVDDYEAKTDYQQRTAHGPNGIECSFALKVLLLCGGKGSETLLKALTLLLAGSFLLLGRLFRLTLFKVVGNGIRLECFFCHFFQLLNQSS